MPSVAHEPVGPVVLGPVRYDLKHGYVAGFWYGGLNLILGLAAVLEPLSRGVFWDGAAMIVSGLITVALSWGIRRASRVCALALRAVFSSSHLGLGLSGRQIGNPALSLAVGLGGIYCFWRGIRGAFAAHTFVNPSRSQTDDPQSAS